MVASVPPEWPERLAGVGGRSWKNSRGAGAPFLANSMVSRGQLAGLPDDARFLLEPYGLQEAKSASPCIHSAPPLYVLMYLLCGEHSVLLFIHYGSDPPGDSQQSE